MQRTNLQKWFHKRVWQFNIYIWGSDKSTQPLEKNCSSCVYSEIRRDSDNEIWEQEAYGLVRNSRSLTSTAKRESGKQRGYELRRGQQYWNNNSECTFQEAFDARQAPGMCRIWRKLRYSLSIIWTRGSHPYTKVSKKIPRKNVIQASHASTIHVSTIYLTLFREFLTYPRTTYLAWNL